MVKLVILLLTGLSNQFEPSMVFDPSEFEAQKFFLLRNMTGLSNQFKPSMVFDPSESEAPKFFLLRNIGEIDRIFKSVRAILGIQPIRVRGTGV